MRSGFLAAVLALAILIVLSGAPTAEALHWSIDVSVSPTQAEASRAIDMIITLTNSGTMSTTVGSVTINLPWDVNATRRIHMDLVLNSIPPGGCLSVKPVDVAAPAEPGIYPWTVDVEARTSGDSLAETKSYSGTIQVVATGMSVPSGATCPTLWFPLLLIGAIVAGIAAIALLVFMRMRAHKRGPPSAPRGRPPEPPPPP